MAQEVLKFIKDNDIKWVDLRFTDTHGKEQHVTIPASKVDESTFEEGETFDGSSIAGWKGINESDMVLMPRAENFYVDPFANDPTLVVRCEILETDYTPYEKDPRSIAKKAEAYLKSTGIADAAFFGPEPEFFIFDGVRWGVQMGKAFYEIDADKSL